MKKYFSTVCAVLLSISLIASGYSANASDIPAIQESVEDQTVSLEEFVSSCGVLLDSASSVSINQIDSEASGAEDTGEYIEITGSTSIGNYYKTIIMPYAICGDKLVPVSLTGNDSRASTGAVSVKFSSVNITVVVTAYYNGTSSALKPLGISGYWTLYNSSGTSNTVSHMVLDYYVFGATYNISSPNDFTNDVSYHAIVDQYSPSKGITYSKYNSLADNIYYTLSGNILYGQQVSVKITVNGTTYNDAFSV